MGVPSPLRGGHEDAQDKSELQVREGPFMPQSC